jgi:16S rRNA (cytosine967-C5)-methyltransferase
MPSPARKTAYKLLSRIDSRQMFSDDALNSGDMESLEIRDRNLTTEIVYGTLRWQGVLDYLLAKVSSRPWDEVEPGARILLRMTVYQMWQMDRVPDHASVNDAVELAKRNPGKGINLYLNGILRNLGRTRPWKKPEFLSGAPPWVCASLPQWLWERWSARFGENTASEFAASLNKPPQACFRIGDADPENLPSPAVFSDVVPGAGILPGGAADPDRIFPHQDEASQLIPHLLGPVAGMRVWDSCAAPGGKSAILSRLCGRNGRVVAGDIRKERILRMIGLRRDGGIAPVDVLVADASKAAPFRRCFDAVLGDVPCSGLGTLRRNPEIKWHFRPEDFRILHRTQASILHSVSETVRAEGRLLYSTCSTEPEENEHVVEEFLGSHPDFRLERPAAPAGIEKWTGSDRMVRTFPGTRLWDGFFAALLVREAQ